MKHRRLACLLAVGFWALGAAAAPGSAVQPGDTARGRAIVTNRRVGLCLLCHSGPFPEEPQQGDLAPGLGGAGRRWTLDQLRSRLEDPERFVPDSLMPAFGRRAGLWRVAPAWQGRPVLTPQQIEDVAAFLATLRD